jgi:hypothetical protein
MELYWELKGKKQEKQKHQQEQEKYGKQDRR